MQNNSTTTSGLNAPFRIVLNQTNLLLSDIFQLTATLTDTKGNVQEQTQPITWVSNSPAIATVDSNGVVTPVAHGTCLIEAQYPFADGETLNTGLIYAQCQITCVAEAVAPPTTVQFVSGTQQGFLDQSAGTTAPIDTTGSDFLVAVLGAATVPSQGLVPTISDSEGNSWQLLTTYGSGSPDAFFYYLTIAYCFNPTVSTAHTFTVSKTATLPAVSISVAAFSGLLKSSSVFEQGTDKGVVWDVDSATAQAGSVMPVNAGDLIVTGGLSVAPLSVDSGFTPAFFDTPDIVCLAYKITANKNAVNPTWTTVSTEGWAVNIAAFRAL